ncbi:MAG: hypothetical protein ABSH38_07795 [Verrucomicrobiota bacterium]
MPKPQPKRSKVKKDTPTRRLKFAGQIREWAKKDIVTATFFAQRGRIFSDMELALVCYYFIWDKFKVLQSGQNPIEQGILGELWTKEVSDAYSKNISQLFAQDRRKLCGIFLNAVENRDAGKILEIAKAVKFLKTFKENSDHCRAGILGLKSVLDKNNRKMPISELARAVKWPASDAKHGFWRLRRIAKELNFPLEPQHK